MPFAHIFFGFTFEFCRNNLQMENASGELSIWLKEKWNPGEVKKKASIFVVYCKHDLQLHNGFGSVRNWWMILFCMCSNAFENLVLTIITINNNPSHNVYIVIAKNSICKVITKTVFATCKGNVELIVLHIKLFLVG